MAYLRGGYSCNKPRQWRARPVSINRGETHARAAAVHCRWSFCGGLFKKAIAKDHRPCKTPPQKTTARAKDHRIGRCRRRPDAAAANALGPQPRIMGVSHVGHGYARWHARLVFSSSNKAPHLTRNHQPHAPSVNRCVHRFRNSVRAREWRAIQEPTLGAVS